MPKKLAITVAGAVSLGSYEAGIYASSVVVTKSGQNEKKVE
jgi:hypothetical protein